MARSAAAAKVAEGSLARADPGLPQPPMPKGGAKLGAWWDEAAAQAACRFFPKYLRHTEGEWAGRPFVLQDWQRDRIIRPIFGWKRADGSRLIRVAWIEIPRKNGKTELAAGMALCLLLGDGEVGGQVYSLAVDKTQAKIVFGKASVMVGMSPALLEKLEPLTTSIFCQQLMAAFKPLSKGAKGKQGLSASGVVGDEVHEWDDQGALADAVHKSAAARRQPLEIYITTAGIRGSGYAWDMHELALEILKGEIEDPTFLPVIFAANDNADWKLEATHRAANPGYGISPKADFIAKECADAIKSPRKENDFRRFHLNQWVEQKTRWLPMDRWNACSWKPKADGLWLNLFALLKGRTCFAGLDLGITTDPSSWCLAFPPVDGLKVWHYLWRFWLPEKTVEDETLPRKKRWESFEQKKAVTLTPGNVSDYDFIEESILKDCAAYQVQKIGIDRFNASPLAVKLLNTHGLPVEYFGQGYVSMSAPSKEFERQVLKGALEHGNHPVAKWMAGNAVIERGPAGNIKPSKDKAVDKIDGIVAAIMALGLGYQTVETEQDLSDFLKNPVMVS